MYRLWAFRQELQQQTRTEMAVALNVVSKDIGLETMTEPNCLLCRVEGVEEKRDYAAAQSTEQH